MQILTYQASIRQSGGITITNGRPANHTAGFQVATDNSVEIKHEELGKILLLADIWELKDFGIWYNDGLWYLDTESKHILNREEAIQKAKEWKQLAIYEWSTGNSITI